MYIKDILSILGFLIISGGIFYNIVKTISIKTNDLAHMEIDVKALLQGQEEVKEKIGKNSERIAKIEGKLD